MDSNKFFKLLSSNPALMWKFVRPFIFIGLAFVLYFVPSYGFGGSSTMRNTFAFLMMIYGAVQVYIFYNEFKRIEDEQERP